MVVTQRNMMSLLTGIILLSLLINPVREILDIPHQSCLFTITLLSGLIGFFSLLLFLRTDIRLTLIDLLFFLLAIGGICFYNPAGNLWGLGRFALIIIYWSIRQTRGLNLILLYIVILASVIVLSTLGYLQWLKILPSNHIYFNITGPYGNPTVYAGVLCLFMSVPTIVLSHFRKKKLSAWLYFISIFVCLFAFPVLWLTNCRSAWIAFLFSAGYAVYHRFSLPFRSKIYVLFLIVLVGYLLYQYKPASVQGRVLIWKVTTQMIKERPLYGFGPTSFTAAYMQFQGDYLKSKGNVRDKQLADNNHYVYNEPLRWLVEYGIAGLLLYIIIVYVISSYKAKKIRSLSAKSICLSGLIWGIFSYPDQTYPVMVIMVIALAEMSNCQRRQKVNISSPWRIYLKIIIFIVIIGQNLLLIKMYCNHKELFHIIRYADNSRSEETIAKLSQLETGMKHERIFWTYYCHTLYTAQRYTILLKKISHWENLYPSTYTYLLKGEVLQNLSKLREAEEAYWTAHYMIPSRQKPRYKLALLYKQQGRVSEAVRLAEELLTEKVKVYSFDTYEMHRELRRIFRDQLNNYLLKK